MGGLLKVFIKPTSFFADDFGKLRLRHLGIFYAVVIFYFFIVSILQTLILGQSLLASLVSFFGTWVLGFLVFIPVFAIVAKLIVNTSNKDFSFYQSLKVILSATVVSYVFHIVTFTLNLILTFFSRDFINSVSTLDPTVQDADMLAGLATQGAAFGIFGLLLTCLFLIGFIWSIVLEVIGVAKVGKVDYGMSVVTVFAANLAGFLLNAAIGFVFGLISASLTLATIM